MSERNSQLNARGDNMLRRMRFSGNGNHRSPFAPQARPAMENLAPQSFDEKQSAAEKDESNRFSCINACSLAMVYSPEQEWRELYPIGKALCRGTLFQELDKPFKGKTLLGR